MRLPAEVTRSGGEHVVGEHGRELRADRTKRTRHCRIHRAAPQVRRVELVDDARQTRELGTLHVRIHVDSAEIIAVEFVPRVQACGIPAKRHALRSRATNRLANAEVLADVVENQFGASRAANRIGECIDISDGPLQILRMMPRLVH